MAADANELEVMFYNWPTKTQPRVSVVLTPHAQGNLRAAHTSTKAGNPVQAAAWLNSVREKILGLSANPEEHPVAPETRLFGHEIREAMLDAPPARILFRIEKAPVQVLDVQTTPTAGQGHDQRLAGL